MFLYTRMLRNIYNNILLHLNTWTRLTHVYMTVNYETRCWIKSPSLFPSYPNDIQLLHFPKIKHSFKKKKKQSRRIKIDIQEITIQRENNILQHSTDAFHRQNLLEEKVKGQETRNYREMEQERPLPASLEVQRFVLFPPILLTGLFPFQPSFPPRRWPPSTCSHGEPRLLDLHRVAGCDSYAFRAHTLGRL